MPAPAAVTGDGRARKRGAGSVGAVEASGAGSGGEMTILIGGAKVEHEIGEGFVLVLLLCPPIAARDDVKQSGGEDEIVAEADDGGCGGIVIAGGSEANAFVELVGEKFVDGRGRIPWSLHSKGIVIKFDLGDSAPGRPGMSKDAETRYTAESEFRIGKAPQVLCWDGGNELIAKGLVRFLVGAEDGLIVVLEKAIDAFCDLRTGGGSRMVRLRGAVDGGDDEGDAARPKEVVGGGS